MILKRRFFSAAIIPMVDLKVLIIERELAGLSWILGSKWVVSFTSKFGQLAENLQAKVAGITVKNLCEVERLVLRESL